MTKNVNKDVRERIYHVLECSNKLKRANLSDTATFDELGFDSLDTVELIVAFEEELGFDLPHEEAENNIKTGNQKGKRRLINS
jgi:NADH dehydrogenase (ubiquinone) 1 alpha/beta subcomplex 1